MAVGSNVIVTVFMCSIRIETVATRAVNSLSVFPGSLYNALLLHDIGYDPERTIDMGSSGKDILFFWEKAITVDPKLKICHDSENRLI